MIKANSRTSITSSLTKNFRVLQVLFKYTWTLVHLGPSVNRPTKVLKRTFVGSESNFRTYAKKKKKERKKRKQLSALLPLACFLFRNSLKCSTSSLFLISDSNVTPSFGTGSGLLASSTDIRSFSWSSSALPSWKRENNASAWGYSTCLTKRWGYSQFLTWSLKDSFINQQKLNNLIWRLISITGALQLSRH